MPVGKESKLANADEAVWKDMLHVAPQELRCREGHQSLFFAACIVLPAESDLFPVEGNEPVITDGNAMGITAQITKQRLWTRQRLFDVDDPVFPMQRLKKSPEGFGIFQWRGRTAETELVPAIRTFKALKKLASKDFLQNADCEKEAIPGSYPTMVVR